uniref:ZZ-type domain-containing protein n=1 Tax=Strigamia maritima TaxID=126957 RepID=T1J1R7_STRMM
MTSGLRGKSPDKLPSTIESSFLTSHCLVVEHSGTAILLYKSAATDRKHKTSIHGANLYTKEIKMADISIKSFYVRTDATTEIRRFAMPKEEAKNFNLLREKLLSIYNGASTKATLSKDDIALFWKDEEGDEVSISSDDELSFALKAKTEDVFKIHVRKIKVKSPSKCYHPGVVCDCCNKEIYGYRYKCMECPNFDLCSACENEGNHSEHSMMRMVSPGARFPHHWFRNRPQNSNRHPKWHKQENGGAGESGCKRPCDGRRARFGEPFHPYNLINRMWSAIGAQMPPQQQEQGQQGQQGQSPRAENNSNEASDSGATAPPNERTSTCHDEYLRNIGETVAAVLDPFGIDVSVDIENGGVRTVIARNKKSSEEKEKEKETKETQSSPDGETGVTENDAETQSEKQDETETEFVAAPTAMSTEDGWTCLGSELLEDSMRNLPELLAEFHVRNDEPLHREPHIASSVEQMMSMGFDNQGGWLTKLIELCHGDVTRVIDLLAQMGESNGPSRAFVEAFVALLEKHGGDTGRAVAIMRSMQEK